MKNCQCVSHKRWLSRAINAKKRGRMSVRHIFMLLFSFVLFSGVVSIGCAARPRFVSPPAAVLRQSPSQPLWVGERAKVLVARFGNKVSLDADVKRVVTDAVLGM